MCKAATTMGRIYSVCVSKCHEHMCVCMEREQRSIKRAFHLAGLSLCSMKNLCFQLSRHYPWERVREKQSRKMTASKKRGDGSVEEGGKNMKCREVREAPSACGDV